MQLVPVMRRRAVKQGETEAHNSANEHCSSGKVIFHRGDRGLGIGWSLGKEIGKVICLGRGLGVMSLGSSSLKGSGLVFCDSR